MKYSEDPKITSFEIDYKKELVKFKTAIFGKKKMSLNEFAISVLQIEPVSTEIIAMYIGKLGFDVYKKSGMCEIMFNKKTKFGISGKILINNKS